MSKSEIGCKSQIFYGTTLSNDKHNFNVFYLMKLEKKILNW